MSDLYEEGRKYLDLDNYAKAFEIFEQGDKEGDIYCSFDLANQLINGKGVKKDEKRANEIFARVFPILEVLAKKGELIAQEKVAIAYCRGYGIETCYEKGIPLLEKLANQGNYNAQFNLACMYHFGEGLEQSDTKAFEWMIKVAMQGYPTAQALVGFDYYYGEGVEQCYEKAVEWFKKASDRGNIIAQNRLGECFEFGIGVEKNEKKAFKLFLKSAEQGLPRAQVNLGYAYRFGSGVEKSQEKAFEWIEKASKNGESLAQYYLSTMYYYGEGVEKDYKKADYWLMKSANGGCKYAQSYLGELYYRGERIDQSYEKAIEWFTKAGERKNPVKEALYYLGDCYHNGLGVQADFKKAKQYYEKAESLGYNCGYALDMVKIDLKEFNEKTCMESYANEILSLGLHGVERKQKIENDLKEEFGDNWFKLKKEAQKALISGIFSYLNFYELGEEVYKDMDFTPSITAMSKALEITLGEYFFKVYIEYLKKKKIPVSAFDSKSCILKVERDDNGVEISREYRNENEINNFSLGAFYYIIDSRFDTIDFNNEDEAENSALSERSVSYRKRYRYIGEGEQKIRIRGERTLNKHIVDYADYIFSNEAFNDINREKEIVNYLIDLSTDVHVIKQQRNPAAHGETMTCKHAEICGDYLIKTRKVIFNFLDKLKGRFYTFYNL